MLAPSTPGESPPPAPRACFGRDELIEEIVGFAENLTPIALIGAGGIGKTSIALAVLHHGRVKQQFGENRRFIRCDQFPATSAHLLSRLSKVMGAGIENPENLTTLYPFLSSMKIFIVLDNAESILNPQGMDAAEIYALVEELSQLETICLCITSRISTVPPDCESLDIPTLSMNAARDTFYRIYKKREQPNPISDILKQLDFHPLSITLLATVAHQNRWSTDRLTAEWGRRRTSVLQTLHNKSLAATIELSLASPLFQELGPDARALLGVVAFFPQGVDENNLDWLLPTISDGPNIFDKFCFLFLTDRSNGFVTMLAPLRDYLSPKDPKSSPLLCMTKEHYFTRMSVAVSPNSPGFGESRWIVSEDTNVEHLLDVFTTVDASSDSVWDACVGFIKHLTWHKKRLTILKPRIEDGHRSKPKCLFELSKLFGSVGYQVQRKQLLTHALKLRRERGDDLHIAQALSELSGVNRVMDNNGEGIQQAKEALEILERLGDTEAQAVCLIYLARLLYVDDQLGAAEKAAYRAIDLFPEEGEKFQVCESHRALGHIYQLKGEMERAIHHLEIALGIATFFDWQGGLFRVHLSLAELFVHGSNFDNAHAHIEQAMSYTADDTYDLGVAIGWQVEVLRRQGRLEEARSKALRVVDIFEKLGAAVYLEEFSGSRKYEQPGCLGSVGIQL